MLLLPPRTQQSAAVAATTDFVEDLGGKPPTPGIGFALGVDRILLAWRLPRVLFDHPEPPVKVFVVDVTGGTHALGVCSTLRRCRYRLLVTAPTADAR